MRECRKENNIQPLQLETMNGRREVENNINKRRSAEQRISFQTNSGEERAEKNLRKIT